jgi:thiol-disulfide isomerase/thioredoxin
MRNGGSIKITNGVTRFVFDLSTGLLVSSRTLLNIDNGHGGYQSDTAYALKRMSYNGQPDEALFRIPSSATKEVKELSPWNSSRIKKQLAGKPAPDFALTDLQGKTIRLSDLKGRTVLLDFWATWCGPCRADGPSLDKLYQKYGAKNLTIIGISVDEERPVVQKFLAEHTHQYVIALTTENEMPRPYQIGVFPTYIVIDPDGNLAFATEGDKGFSDLRKLLQKAGLDTD